MHLVSVFARRQRRHDLNDDDERQEPEPLDDATESLQQESPYSIPSSSKWRRRRILSVYLVTSTLLYADLSLMAPNLSAIADEFGFDDNERDVKLGGMIALAFFLVGVPVALLIGWLTDFVNRSPLYAIVVFLGEVACFAVYFTTTFGQLFAMRTLTGISIGGSLPVVFSVLGDLYPAQQRNGVAAIITCGTGLGIGLGQGLAGFLGPTYGWRFPFLIVSVPGMVCSFLLWFIKDPERGQMEAATMEFNDEQRAYNVLVVDDEDQEHDGEHSLTLESGDVQDNDNASVSERQVVEVEEKQNATDDKRQHSDDIEAPLNNPTSIVLNEPDQEANECHSNNTDQSARDALQQFECSSRGHTAATTNVEKETKVSWTSTWEMLKTPSVALTLLQAAPSAVPFGFCSVFLNDYLAENRGMTVEEATGVLITFGVGNAIGVLFGGIFGHYGYKRDVRLPPAIMGTSLILSCVPMYFLVNRVHGDSNVGMVAIVSMLAGILAVIPVPLERAILTNVTVPQSRGRANSFLSIIDDLGKGLGPALVSVMIQALDRPQAFNLSLLGWIIGGLISFTMTCFVKKDEAMTQERVWESLEREQAIREQELINLSCADSPGVCERASEQNTACRRPHAKDEE